MDTINVEATERIKERGSERGRERREGSKRVGGRDRKGGRDRERGRENKGERGQMDEGTSLVADPTQFLAPHGPLRSPCAAAGFPQPHCEWLQMPVNTHRTAAGVPRTVETKRHRTPDLAMSYYSPLSSGAH